MGVSACGCLHKSMCAHGGQRYLIPRKLELQEAVTHAIWVLEIELGSSGRAGNILPLTESPSQPSKLNIQSFETSVPKQTRPAEVSTRQLLTRPRD